MTGERTGDLGVGTGTDWEKGSSRGGQLPANKEEHEIYAKINFTGGALLTSRCLTSLNPDGQRALVPTLPHHTPHFLVTPSSYLLGSTRSHPSHCRG